MPPTAAGYTGWQVEPTPQCAATFTARFDSTQQLLTQAFAAIDSRLERANTLLAEIAAKPSGGGGAAGGGGGTTGVPFDPRPILQAIQSLSSRLDSTLTSGFAQLSTRLGTLATAVASVDAAQQRTTNAVEQQSGWTRNLVQQSTTQLVKAVNTIPPAVNQSAASLTSLLRLRDGWDATGAAYWLAALARHFRIA